MFYRFFPPPPHQFQRDHPLQPPSEAPGHGLHRTWAVDGGWMGGGWAVDGDGFIKIVIIINNIRRWLCVLRAHQGQEQRLCQRQSLACFELIKDKNRSDRRLKIAYQVELYTIVLLACQDLWTCSDKETSMVPCSQVLPPWAQQVQHSRQASWQRMHHLPGCGQDS